MASDPRVENDINTLSSGQGPLPSESIKYEEINKISIKGFGEKQQHNKTKAPKIWDPYEPQKLFNHFLPILQNEQDNT